MLVNCLQRTLKITVSSSKTFVRLSTQLRSEYPPEKVFIKNRYANFVDSLRIKVTGGDGGNGLPRFGGVGGDGGSVFVEATEKVSLKLLRDKAKSYKASGGGHSNNVRIVGKAGGDCVVRVPVGVEVFDESGTTLGQLDKSGDRILVAAGGYGGGPKSKFCGTKGQNKVIVLDLKLIADIGFVGFPNAGKSTLLKALSRASPKIANYPFTTINPNIGIMEYEDFRNITVADLPGLIEGAHANLGLGHSFLKHIERTKLLVFVIDVNGFRYRPDWPSRTPLETLLLLNKELELYDDRLLSKPAVLVISKLDGSLQQEKFENFLKEFNNLKTDDLEVFDEKMRPNQLIKMDEIVGVCAKKAINISELKECLRKVIDVNFEIDREKRGENTSFRQLLEKETVEKQSDDAVLL